MSTRVIPCLLLKHDKLVKTIKFSGIKYVGDPINTVKIYNEKEVDELIILDITATSEDRSPPFKLLKQLANECFMPISYGGGIKNVKHIKKLFKLGIEKVIINSTAIKNSKLIEDASNVFGSQSIIVSLDVKKNCEKKYKIFSNRGKIPTGINPVKFAIKMEKKGAGELFINNIDKDGTMTGYDVKLLRQISNSINIPTIACGGAGHYGDLRIAAKQGKVSAVAAGSIFIYAGKNKSVLINFPTRKKINQMLN